MATDINKLEGEEIAEISKYVRVIRLTAFRQHVAAVIAGVSLVLWLAAFAVGFFFGILVELVRLVYIAWDYVVILLAAVRGMAKLVANTELSVGYVGIPKNVFKFAFTSLKAKWIGHQQQPQQQTEVTEQDGKITESQSIN